MKLVVAGTDTGIGKTVFAAALSLSLAACYWKPVQAGLEGETDSAFAARMGVAVLPEAYRLTQPKSPHLAAAQDGLAIMAEKLALPGADPLVVETAGGVLTPLSETLLFADQMKRWNLPVALCARTQLGTISHSLMALEALRVRGIGVLGVVFIGEANDESEAAVASIGKVKRLGRLPMLAQLTGPALRQAFAAHFNLADFHA